MGWYIDDHIWVDGRVGKVIEIDNIGRCLWGEVFGVVDGVFRNGFDNDRFVIWSWLYGSRIDMRVVDIGWFTEQNRSD